MSRLFSLSLLVSIIIFFFVGCQLEPLEPEVTQPDIQSQDTGPYQIQQAKKSDLQQLGLKMNKRLGINIIQSAQSREISDFIFDLEASLLTQDTTARKTYTVPFLSKEDRYSTYNLVIVTDSLDQLLDQYVLAYEIDSAQYPDFVEHGDILEAGTTIKRYSFSSFFNDSNPLFLERCQGITDENGDPVVCDQVTLDFSSGGGGGGSGSGGVWIAPGGATNTGNGAPSSGSSGSGGGTPCTWTVTSIREEVPNYGGSYCESSTSCITGYVVTISCGDAYSRKSASQNEGMMTCMDCELSDFGTPAFTPTKISTAINRDLNEDLSDYHLEYLSHPDNQTFAKDLWQALGEDDIIDKNSALFTISAGMNGVLDKPFTPEFALAVDELVEADLSNPSTLHLFYTYFSAKAAMLKLENPQKYLKNPNGSPGDSNNIYTARLYIDVFSEAAHWTLDIAGLVPVLGEPADLINGVLYAIEGDGVNATLSVVSALPFYGYITSGPKIGFKVIQSATDLQSRKVLRWIVDREGFITFGDQSQLRKVIGLTDPNKRAHHIIPWQKNIQEHPVVQKAARSKDSFHLNEALNGVPVDKSRNVSHKDYNDLIKLKLDQINNSRNQGKSDEFFYDELVKLINNAKNAIESSDLPINQIRF
ncbi:AHH domain-containing protein [Algoriphagus formosus]|uniref:AHH domain-containing protein n=1 Tax=Algoriphagus formosus TaxID=2007308 RepID=UPI003F6FD73D